MGTKNTMKTGSKNAFQWHQIVHGTNLSNMFSTKLHIWKPHISFLRTERKEDRQQSWQLHSVEWFPNWEQQTQEGPFLLKSVEPCVLGGKDTRGLYLKSDLGQLVIANYQLH